MVDRNNNGIPDDRERAGAVKRAQPISPIGGRRLATSTDQRQPVVQNGEKGSFDLGASIGSMVNGAQGFIGSLLGGGQKAKVANVAPRSAPQGQLWKMNQGPRQGNEGIAEQEKSFADYLQEALGMIGGQGGGGGVNYDPQRNTLKGQAGENDARLEAMYRQLRGSIDADAPVIQQAYQQAMDSTAANSATAQQQTQAANDSALAQQNSVLSALGIQEAQGNQIQQGTDLSTQTAGQIGSQAELGQAAGNRLASNQATALAHNTNIGNAAGLEGNLQRASNNARLQALLAEIDMQEQQQNASVQDNSFSTGLSLAQQLYGMDQDKQARQDELQMSAAEMAAQGQQKTSLPNFDEMLQALAARGIAIPEDPRQLATLMDSARRYSF